MNFFRAPASVSTFLVAPIFLLTAIGVTIGGAVRAHRIRHDCDIVKDGDILLTHASSTLWCTFISLIWLIPLLILFFPAQVKPREVSVGTWWMRALFNMLMLLPAFLAPLLLGSSFAQLQIAADVCGTQDLAPLVIAGTVFWALYAISITLFNSISLSNFPYQPSPIKSRKAMAFKGISITCGCCLLLIAILTAVWATSIKSSIASRIEDHCSADTQSRLHYIEEAAGHFGWMAFVCSVFLAIVFLVMVNSRRVMDVSRTRRTNWMEVAMLTAVVCFLFLIAFAIGGLVGTTIQPVASIVEQLHCSESATTATPIVYIVLIIFCCFFVLLAVLIRTRFNYGKTIGAIDRDVGTELTPAGQVSSSAYVYDDSDEEETQTMIASDSQPPRASSTMSFINSLS